MYQLFTDPTNCAALCQIGASPSLQAPDLKRSAIPHRYVRTGRGCSRQRIANRVDGGTADQGFFEGKVVGGDGVEQKACLGDDFGGDVVTGEEREGCFHSGNLWDWG